VSDAPRRTLRASHPWAAVLLGASTGFLAAALGIGLWTFVHSHRDDLPPRREVAQIDLFRLPSGATHEAMLVPAGPDATGEPRLAAALFPGGPRELVTLLVANVSPTEPWDVDLVGEPLRCRSGTGAWETIEPLTGRAAGLPPADGLRLRSLGSEAAQARLEPGSLRPFLLALPDGRRLSDLTDVQWGDRPLTRDRLGLERLRRFREDPAGMTTGR